MKIFIPVIGSILFDDATRQIIMDEKTIVEALKKGERVTLECKKAKSEIPSSVWSTYSSFANTEGGLILLGVNEDPDEPDIAKRFTVTGVNNVAKMKKDF